MVLCQQNYIVVYKKKERREEGNHAEPQRAQRVKNIIFCFLGVFAAWREDCFYCNLTAKKCNNSQKHIFILPGII